MTEHNSETANHGYTIPEEGETDWHIPINTNFEKLDVTSEVRDIESNLGEYEPKPGSKFFAIDSGKIYLGDGSSWTEQWDLGAIGSGGGGNHTSVKGIDDTRQHVGPLHSGVYHEDGDNMWGIHFTANADLSIVSTVVDFDAGNSTTTDVSIALYEAETTNTGENNQPQSVVPSGMTESEALIDSTTTTLSDGPQRVSLNFQTPSSPMTGEFFLGVKPTTAGETIYMRRAESWDGWSDYTFDHIDLQFGSRWDNTTTRDYSGNYYRVFDIEIGDATTNVTSPWSHDVDEIYMRPRDPAEEFDDVSPRALWIDTS